jgi:hypothetical protein
LVRKLTSVLVCLRNIVCFFRFKLAITHSSNASSLMNTYADSFFSVLHCNCIPSSLNNVKQRMKSAHWGRRSSMSVSARAPLYLECRA